MKKLTQEQKSVIRETLNFILVLLLLIASIWFIGTFKKMYKEGDLKTWRGQHNERVLLNQVTTINNIKVWMTFDYLNTIFKLDPIYLQKTLNINDLKYPNIRIDHYARNHGLNSFSLLDSIQKSITNYPSGIN